MANTIETNPGLRVISVRTHEGETTIHVDTLEGLNADAVHAATQERVASQERLDAQRREVARRLSGKELGKVQDCDARWVQAYGPDHTHRPEFDFIRVSVGTAEYSLLAKTVAPHSLPGRITDSTDMLRSLADANHTELGAMGVWTRDYTSDGLEAASKTAWYAGEDQARHEQQLSLGIGEAALAEVTDLVQPTELETLAAVA